METVVLALDIGHSGKNRATGDCVLRWNEPEVSWILRRIPMEAAPRRAALHELLPARAVAAAALDAPFQRELDEIGVDRDAELLRTRGLRRMSPVTGRRG